MNELDLYRTLHSLLCVARLAAECRQAINLLAAAAGDPPYQVDELDSAALDALSALAETLRRLEHGSVPVERAIRRGDLVPLAHVSRETSPDTDPRGYPF